MNGKSKKLPVNYSIGNIVSCILDDNRTAGRQSESRKKKLYAERLEYLRSFPRLKKALALSSVRNYPIQGAPFFARIGILPPELVIVDQRFKDMCRLPFWTVYNDSKGNIFKRFGKCTGHGWLPGCPPDAPPVHQVQEILQQSDLFIVLQTRLLAERWNTGWKFSVLHRLVKEIKNICGEAAVTGLYGSGPCSACASQPCRSSAPCRTPDLKTVSLEAMGICVDRICTDLAMLTGNNAWKIRWVKHFGFPQQTPKRWKYVEAVSLKL